MSCQSIGLLGGTFDPVHNGHLAVAAAVKQALALDAVWFIPAAMPPHKNGQAISSFEDRVAMLEAAVNNRAGYLVSRIEAERPQPSYTIDTLLELRRRLGAGGALFFMIGADAFAEIATWKAYDRLPTLASLVVITRPAHPPREAAAIIRRYFRGHEFVPAGQAWMTARGEEKIFILDMPPVAVSSTEIRAAVRAGRTISGLVPPAVEAYIGKRGLYR